MKKNISISQLYYALSLEEQGNFRSAAKKCRITQPTLSMQINKLEKELGIILFDRSKKPTIPTLLGKKVLDQARKALQELNEIENIISSGKKEVSGTYRVGIIPSLAPYLVPLFLAAFTRKFPLVRLSIQEALSEEITKRLNNDQLDCGIIATPYPFPGLQEYVLFYEPLYAYISQSHPLYQQTQISRNSVELKNLWILEEGHCLGSQVLELCKKRDRIQQIQSNSFAHFESSSLDTVKSLVDQGLGMTFLPELAVKKLVSSEDRSKLRSFSTPVPVREISCVRTRIFSKKSIFDALVSSIQENIPQHLLKKPQSAKVIPIKSI